MNNPVLGPDNAPVPVNAPVTGTVLDTLRETFAELPLGITASGELGLKVIVIGNASIGIKDLPTADPHKAGAVWNNNGTPTISQG